MSSYVGQSNGPFEWTPENKTKAEEILGRYPEGQSASGVMPLLDLAQRQNQGWLSIEAIVYVADYLGLPEVQVWEVATFYSLFNIKPLGKHVIRVCGTTPCALQGSSKVLKTCEKWLGIEAGQTTQDGMFTLEEVECLGACANAPLAYIHDQYYEDLTPASMTAILESLADGDIPHAGSQKRESGEKEGEVC
ncbi:MAG: NADH-quinone oxidoreductase subunit NuoE [Rickettsiales bacterium]|nr:NADH-quinone oxidoreductase subunit NuoE [Rickettsiales bacterium]|tara:strand:+ start:2098 stop:2673 length:576 start_codon:yes stop_codon:yes gene_type:complete